MCKWLEVVWENEADRAGPYEHNVLDMVEGHSSF